MIDLVRLSRLNLLLSQTTPGVWRGHEDSGVDSPSGPVFETGCGCCTKRDLSDADAQFIAESHNFMPEIIAAFTEMQEKIDLMEDQIHTLLEASE